MNRTEHSAAPTWGNLRCDRDGEYREEDERDASVHGSRDTGEQSRRRRRRPRPRVLRPVLQVRRHATSGCSCRTAGRERVWHASPDHRGADTRVRTRHGPNVEEEPFRLRIRRLVVVQGIR